MNQADFSLSTATINNSSTETVAELRAEIERLKAVHEQEVRRIEIEGYRTEIDLAIQLKQARSSGMRQYLKGKDAPPLLHEDRTFLGKVLFRKDGKPHKPLRSLLFTRTGRPRRIARRFVLHKNGRPRRRFREWMESESYLRLPHAYRV